MSKWNLRLDDNLVELEGRTLEPESIIYSDRSVRYKQQEADWSRDGIINYLNRKKLIFLLFKVVIVVI